MRATITQTQDGYYILDMNGREMGGTSKSRLAEYAKKQGFSEIEYKDDRKKKLKAESFNPFQNTHFENGRRRALERLGNALDPQQKSIEQQGRDARAAGKTIKDCPYPQGHRDYNAWMFGFDPSRSEE